MTCILSEVETLAWDGTSSQQIFVEQLVTLELNYCHYVPLTYII